MTGHRPNGAAAESRPPHPLRRILCRVAAAEMATHDIRIIRLEQGDGGPLVFSAGQYAALAFDGLPARDYSMANRPDEPALEFHIRDLGDGVSRHAVRRLAPGDRVMLEGPFGEAWLRADHPGPILAIAGGSGLAPIKAIVETALALGLRQDIHLYFGCRTARDLYLERHFLGLAARHQNLRYVPVLSEPGPGAGGRRTRPVGAAVAADFRALHGAKAYLAGPPAMIEATLPMLQLKGVAAEDIHADPFVTEAEKAAAAQPGR